MLMLVLLLLLLRPGVRTGCILVRIVWQFEFGRNGVRCLNLLRALERRLLVIFVLLAGARCSAIGGDERANDCL